MKKSRLLIAFLLGISCIFSACATNPSTSSQKEENSISSESIVETSSIDSSSDSSSETKIPLYAGEYECYSVYTHYTRDELLAGVDNPYISVSAADYFLDLKADNTFILMGDRSRADHTALYGEWSRSWKKITLTAVTGEVFDGEIDGKYIKFSFPNDSYTSVKLVKKTEAEPVEENTPLGTYTFLSYTQTYDDEEYTISLGDMTQSWDKEYIVTEAFFIVDLQKDGRAIILGDENFGIKDGHFCTWTQEGNMIRIIMEESPDVVFEFTLNENQLSLYHVEAEGETLEIVLQKANG